MFCPNQYKSITDLFLNMYFILKRVVVLISSINSGIGIAEILTTPIPSCRDKLSN